MLSIKYVGEIEINQSRGNIWRLVHDGKQVRTLLEGSDRDITSSMSIIEEFTTSEEALSRIEELKLDDSVLDNSVLDNSAF